MVHKIRHASDFILIFSKVHNSRKGDNSVKKKKKRAQLFFHEESIHEISKPEHARFTRYSMHVSNGRTHGQPETYMPGQLLRSWGQNKALSLSRCILSVFRRLMCLISFISPPILHPLIDSQPGGHILPHP